MPDMSTGDTPLIVAECQKRGLLRNQCAYVLATAWLETARTMKPVEEAFYLGEPKASNYRARLRYAPWWGRGYCQLTWEDNYKRAGDKLGINLTKDPTVAMRPEVAAPVLVQGMKDGWFTGKKLSDYITLQRSDFVGARRIVNGTDKAAEFAKVAQEYDRQLGARGYGVEPVLPPDVEPVDPPAPGFLAALAAILQRIFGGK